MAKNKAHIPILRRPQNFVKSPPIIWLAVHRTNNWWRFHKILWLFQNIWTLKMTSTVYTALLPLDDIFSKYDFVYYCAMMQLSFAAWAFVVKSFWENHMSLLLKTRCMVRLDAQWCQIFFDQCCWHVIRKAIWRNLEVINLEILCNIC